MPARLRRQPPCHRAQPRAHARSRRMRQHHRPEETRAAGVAARLGMGALVQLEQRADRHPARQIQIGAAGGDREQALGVGPHSVAEPRRQARQAARVRLHAQQQLQRPQHPGGQHHPARPHAERHRAQRPQAAARLDQPALTPRMRPHGGDAGVRQDPRPAPLGQPQIVAVEGVLGSVAAAEKAAAAPHAAGAQRPGTAEVRVGDGAAGLALVDPDPVRAEARRAAQRARRRLQRPVGRAQLAVGRRAQHRERGPVVGLQFPLPVGQPRPAALGEERARRARERVAVHDRAAADPHPRHDRDMAQESHLKGPAPAQRRQPEPARQLPGGARQRARGEPPALLQHQHPVALLGEPQRRHAAAEARADHRPVEPVPHLALPHRPHATSSWRPRHDRAPYAPAPARRRRRRNGPRSTRGCGRTGWPEVPIKAWACR
ncbi:MAG: hypothetical protein KatS3mg102_1678 [Planctomycetota bacterium]|nr:MAG: hypothetical protein KatS3mg102_1678 [Planctomycetota bacterium]